MAVSLRARLPTWMAAWKSRSRMGPLTPALAEAEQLRPARLPPPSNYVELCAVAGGDDGPIAVLLLEGGQGRRQLGGGEGESLAHLDGRRLVVGAEEYYRHDLLLAICRRDDGGFQ